MLRGDNVSAPIPSRRRTVVALGMVALLAISFLFFNVLLRTPMRTPLLIVTASYAPPWDMNPWVAENSQAIRALDRHSLAVKSLEDSGRMAVGQWSEFEDKIAQLDHAAAPDKPILLYINMHGIVDRDSRPCLLVRDSKPLDSSTWLPLQSLIDHASNAMKHNRSMVLFLECGRQTEHVPHEQGESHFASAVRNLVESYTRSPQKLRLAVIASTNTNRSSADPLDGGGDPFTRFLAAGLSGRCNERHRRGNLDNQVDLADLNTFIDRETKNFAIRNRGFPQSTFFFDSAAAPLSVAWAGNSNNSPTIPAFPAVSTATIQRIESAWRDTDALRTKAPWQYSPAAWGSLVQHAVAMESTAFGSEENAKRFVEFAKRFQQQCDDLKSGRTNATLGSEDIPLNARIAREEAAGWKKLAAEPTVANAVRISGEHRAPGIFVRPATPFVSHLATLPHLPIWKSPKLLAQFAVEASRLEEVRTCPGNLLNFQSVSEQELQLDSLRRSIEDRLLLESFDESLPTDIESFGNRSRSFAAWVLNLHDAYNAQVQAIADLLPLVRAIDALDAIAIDSHASPLGEKIESVFDRLVDNATVLRKAYSSKNPIQLLNVKADLDSIKSEVARHWKELLHRKTERSSGVDIALYQLLQSGFLPGQNESLETSIQMRLATRKLLVNKQSAAKTREVANGLEKERTFDRRCEKALASLVERTVEMGDRDGRSDTGETTQPSKGGLAERACRSQDLLAATESYEAQKTSMMIARLLATVCLDNRCNNIVQDWNTHENSRRFIRSSYRAIEDFWNIPKIRSQPYFVALASEYLQAASTGGYAAKLQNEVDEVSRLLAARQDAAKLGIKLQAAYVPNWSVSASNTIRCEVEPVRNQLGLPAGWAALQAESIQPTIARSHLQEKIRVGPGMSTQVASLPIPNLAENARLSERTRYPLFARLHFRGHFFETAFEVDADVRNISSANSAPVGLASVQIQDPRIRRRARTLILDCSASMIDMHPIEGKTAIDVSTDLNKSKLVAARWAMQSILSRWQGTSDLIGVILFGHRVALGGPEQGSLFQDRYFRQYPFSQALQAFEDVETILPVGRFAEAEFSSVMDRLELILPWGQTPLYLALMQALQETPHLGNGIQHDIIVISDGRNYQFNPSNEKNVAIDSVILQAKQVGARIHIVGFGIPESELPEATVQFRRLAQETGGTVAIDVANALELARRVEMIAQPDIFSVQLADGQLLQGQCGQALAIPQSLQANTPIWINYRNQQLVAPASPRSAIRLFVGADARLVSAEYLDGSEPSRAALVNANASPSPFRLGVHDVGRDGNDLRWRLSVERNDGGVPQRPKFVWVEVEPIIQSSKPLKQSQGMGYRISDESWLPDLPLPVLHFSTRNWPSSAIRGAVRFWCSDKPPRSIGEIDIPSTLLNGRTPEAKTQKGQLPGGHFRYQVEADVGGLVLILHQSNDEVDNHEIAPRLNGYTGSVRVERQYVAEQRVSIHRFILTPTPAVQTSGIPNSDSGRDRLSLSILDMGDVKRQGLRLSMPLEIALATEIAGKPSSPEPILRR